MTQKWTMYNLDTNLVEEIKKVAGLRQQSAFVTEALTRHLAFTKSAGGWTWLEPQLRAIPEADLIRFVLAWQDTQSKSKLGEG